MLTVLEDGRVVFGGCGWTFVTDHENEIRQLLAELKAAPVNHNPPKCRARGGGMTSYQRVPLCPVLSSKPS